MLLLPDPRLPEAHQTSFREYIILFAGKAFYLTYMLVLPVLVLERSPLLVAGAFLLVHVVVGLSVTLVFQTTTPLTARTSRRPR